MCEIIQIYHQMVDICYKANYTGLINRQPRRWLFFWPKSHHPVDKGGDTTAKSHIRIDPEQIPKVEQKILCATILEAVIRFYEAPERKLPLNHGVRRKEDAQMKFYNLSIII